MACQSDVAPLDKLRTVRDDSRRLIAGLQQKYRDQTGIDAGGYMETDTPDESIRAEAGLTVNADTAPGQRGIDAGKEQIDEIRSRAAQKVGEAVVEAVGGNGKH